ncbi:hypothetical protein MLD38_030613 [Melastoma candidum]|uniref:Uncharacterized protein n=1 Tax=Melastoma candidum TaxID=119954 RepID=A0ACB9MLX8_9MYRT|nr:hypothetical protein MLD38_030613 [Melastoma candidum]
MVMARILSPSPSPSPGPLLSLTQAKRLFSSSSSSSDPLLRKLEDVIHHLIVRRSEPDWLPFRPGSSYWVPPRSRSRGIARLIGKLATAPPHPHPNNPHPHPHFQGPSSLSANHPRGWPSTSYYLHGAGVPTPTPPRTEPDETADNPSQSEDE